MTSLWIFLIYLTGCIIALMVSIDLFNNHKLKGRYVLPFVLFWPVNFIKLIIEYIDEELFT
jgi:hypothetical protein